MDEREFIELIDGQFPFDDRGRALGLVGDAASISPNALFGVVFEACYPGQSATVDLATREAVLAEVEKHCSHSLCPILLPLARRLMRGDRIAVPEAVAIMRRVAPFPGLGYALNIAYGATADHDDILDDVDREIREEWSASEEE